MKSPEILKLHQVIPLQQVSGEGLHRPRFQALPGRKTVNLYDIYIYIQSRAEVRAIFLNVDKPLAEKSPRPGHSRVTAIHQNTRGLPSFEGYKVTVCEKEKEEEEDKKRNKKKH